MALVKFASLLLILWLLSPLLAVALVALGLSFL